MTEVKQYLSIVVDAGTWSDPNNVLGSEDNVCASKTTTGGGSALLVAQPICSVPSNAIIDYVYVDGKGFHNHGPYAGGQLDLYVYTDDFSWPISSWLGLSSGSCLQTYYKGETEILALWRAMGYDITPDDLNGVNFHYLRFGWQHIAGLAGIYTSYADAGYVRVIYHLPPPAVGYRRGDGLVWIRKTAFFKQRGNHFRYRDRKRGREREYTLVGVRPSRTRRFCGCRRVGIGSARLSLGGRGSGAAFPVGSARSTHSSCMTTPRRHTVALPIPLGPTSLHGGTVERSGRVVALSPFHAPIKSIEFLSEDPLAAVLDDQAA